MSAASQEFTPALPLIQIEPGKAPWLAGSRCSNCGATFPGARMACASCGGRDTLEPVRLGETGKLYSYTIVHRSYPGVPTPFVAAVVDLAGGGTLRGTLTGIEAKPEALTPDLPIDVVFRDTGQKDKEGKAFLSYYFVPSKGAQA